MGVSKNRGVSPKMDDENNGKPYFLMDDLGGFLETSRPQPLASWHPGSPPCWDQSLVLQLVDLHVRLRSKPPLHHVVALPAVYLCRFQMVSCGWNHGCIYPKVSCDFIIFHQALKCSLPSTLSCWAFSASTISSSKAFSSSSSEAASTGASATPLSAIGTCDLDLSLHRTKSCWPQHLASHCWFMMAFPHIEIDSK